MITAQKAQVYLTMHGNVFHTAITEDGLLAKSWERGTEESHEEGDEWFEALTVFPVVGGMVDIKPIRAWLGY